MEEWVTDRCHRWKRVAIEAKLQLSANPHLYPPVISALGSGSTRAFPYQRLSSHTSDNTETFLRVGTSQILEKTKKKLAGIPTAHPVSTRTTGLGVFHERARYERRGRRHHNRCTSKTPP